MHIWQDIFFRELAMLVALLALGSGPAAFLSRRFDPGARLAMAPVLGLCLGTCVFTTLIWFTPASNTYWVLPVLALASVAVALWRTWQSHSADHGKRWGSAAREALGRLGAGDAIAIALVCVIVAAPFSYTLHERHSVGPTGFEVWDAVAFTAEADGAVHDSFHAAESKANIFGQNFAQMYWAGTASQDQQIDAVPISANLNELLGLASTDTQTLFMIAFLIAGALGAFATVRYFAPKPRWAAPLAGGLFAGPFFLQLIADGSQPATCGLALILPIAAVGADVIRGPGVPNGPSPPDELSATGGWGATASQAPPLGPGTIRRPRVASLVLFALLLSGLLALYPLFIPAIAVSIGTVLAVLGVRAWRTGRLNRRGLAWVAGSVGLVIALSIVFNIVSFLRDAQYWHQVLEGGYYLSGFPQYHLSYTVLPGWLLQTREFYFLTNLGDASFGEILIAVIVPLVFCVAIAFGLKRRRAALLFLLPLVIFAAMGEYTSAAHNCSYCTDRTLLPIAPLSVGLLVVGIAALASAPVQWLRWAGVAMAIIAVIAIGERTRQERTRFADSSYFLEEGNRALLSHLPSNKPGSLDIEAFSQDPGRAPGELELVYLLAYERNHGQVSLPSEYVDYAGLAYLTNWFTPRNPQFNPNYRYVLTRLGGVQTGRRVLARTGSVALEERLYPLDVTLVSGIGLPLERLDSTGLAWIEGPLHMIVVGHAPGRAWVSLRFKASVPVTIPGQREAQVHRERDGYLSICVPARGSAPVRKSTVTLTFPLAPGILPAEPFAAPEPPQGVQLTAMRVASHCLTPA
jgi:hypothetical protein